MKYNHRSHNHNRPKRVQLLKSNPPDSATSSSGPSPPPAAAGASASQTTGSLAPGLTGSGPSSSDATPCCYRWPQLIGCSLPLLPVRRHAGSRLKEVSSYSQEVLTGHAALQTQTKENRKDCVKDMKAGLWMRHRTMELISGRELILDQLTPSQMLFAVCVRTHNISS